jgi:hypothetical protein
MRKPVNCFACADLRLCAAQAEVNGKSDKKLTMFHKVHRTPVLRRTCVAVFTYQ